MSVKVIKLHELATFEKAHPTDVGYDLTCCGEDVKDGVTRLKLGVVVEPPVGIYFMLVPRSSFCKTGWTQANNVGIIDPDYRGEWMMNVVEMRAYAVADNPDRLIGKKVAQAVPLPMFYYEPEFVSEVTDTVRGEKGFGSTDINPCGEIPLPDSKFEISNRGIKGVHYE